VWELVRLGGIIGNQPSETLAHLPALRYKGVGKKQGSRRRLGVSKESGRGKAAPERCRPPSGL